MAREEKGRNMLEEKRYRLIYNGDVMADNITIDTVNILIKAFCEQYFNEESHSFQLIAMEKVVMSKRDSYLQQDV